MGFLGKLLGLAPKQPPVSVNDDNYVQEVVNSPIPVILDIWGSRCAACKQLEPVLMELAAAYDGKVKVCEMNAEQAPRRTVQLGVRGTPTVIYFRGGKEVERVVGFRGSLYHKEAIAELFQVEAD